MGETSQTDYVLGTNADEFDRLSFQHGVWKDTVLACWQRVGIQTGSRVVDVGCGPGFATLDLAPVVGPTGQVIGLERSINFSNAAKEQVLSQGIQNVTIQTADLMGDNLPVKGMDFAWCRWVASFVSSPLKLVQNIHDFLRPGGTAIFFEYLDYASWRMLPHEPMVLDFVTRVMTSWRETGGEPDVAPSLVGALHTLGFTLVSARPHVFCARPGEPVWQWIEGFMRVNTQRSLENGTVTLEWANAFHARLDSVKKSRSSLMTSPMVLEIVATRPV